MSATPCEEDRMRARLQIVWTLRLSVASLPKPYKPYLPSSWFLFRIQKPVNPKERELQWSLWVEPRSPRRV